MNFHNRYRFENYLLTFSQLFSVSCLKGTFSCCYIFLFVFVHSNKTKLWQEGYRPVSVSGCPVSASAILFAMFSLEGGEQTARSHLTNQVKDTMYRSLKDFSIATYLSIPQGVPSENFTCVQAADDWPCSNFFFRFNYSGMSLHTSTAIPCTHCRFVETFPYLLSGDLYKSGPGHFASERSFIWNHICFWKYVKNFYFRALNNQSCKRPFFTSRDIENFKSWQTCSK